MDKTILIVIFALAAFALALIIILYRRGSSYVQWKRTEKGPVNYDTLMQTFVYRVDLTADALFAKLCVPNINDEMKYELSEDRKTITFMMEPGEREPCDLLVEPKGNGCLLRVHRTILFAPNYVGDLPLLMNPFWIHKVQAEPVAYSDFA